MKTGVIIPDRGDRAPLLKHCLYLLSKQTLQPDDVNIVNYPPKSAEKDITQRYRIGYDYFRNKKFDLIFFIENDDWYHADYMKNTVDAWQKANKPDLFGQRRTVYYHIGLFGYFTMNHEQRGAAMNTVIKPDLQINWCPDNEPYTDCWLYEKLKYNLWSPENDNCLGIKGHGMGITGGQSHVDKTERYLNNPGRLDENKSFLKKTVDEESFNFYCNYLSK